MQNGASAEIAVAGNDGLVGIALFMGGESTPSRAVVQSAGHGYRLNAGALKTEFVLGGPQELIANMLGVRREGVTEAAGKLQDAGIINTFAATLPCSTAPSLKRGCANVMRSLKEKWTACCRTPFRAEPLHAPHYRKIYLFLSGTPPPLNSGLDVSPG
jgi:hypothetical protein